MNILLTGGSGLIGKALSDRLSKDGHRIWVLSRFPEKIDSDAPVQPVKWDGRSTFGWSHLVNEMHAIVNLAGASLGEKRWTQKQKVLLKDSRLYTTDAVVNAMKNSDNKPGVLIQASAVGYYGVHSGDLLLDENSPAGDDYLSSICLDWEEASLPVEEFGIRRVILRTGIVLSPKGGALERLVLPIRFFMGGPLGTGRQWWSWIHIHDVVEAIHFLLIHQTAEGPINLTSPNPVRMNDFGINIAARLQRPYLLPVPSLALKLLLGEMSTMVLDGQRVYPSKLLQAGFRFEFPELSAALGDIFSLK